MAQKPLGYVRLVWHCPQCDSKVPGPIKVCGNCGFPQPEDVAFEQPAQETFITDESELAQAKAGPDLHCFYCDTRNSALRETCSQCGASLDAAKTRESGQVLGAHRDDIAKPIVCTSCGTPNNPDEDKCVQCGASLRKAEPVQAKPEKSQQLVERPHPLPSRAGKRVPTSAIVGVGLLICAVVGVIGYFLSRTEEVTGQVQGVEWEREIAIEGLVPVERSDWLDQIPNDAPLGTCTQKVRRTQDSPTSNSREVCGTPYTKDTGSGFGEVVQDCRYEVYEDWCEYTVEEWQVVDTATRQGADFAPQWPTFQLNEGQREGEREEKYICLFQTESGPMRYTTHNLDIYNLCQPNSRWVLEVGVMGGVRAITPQR